MNETASFTTEDKSLHNFTLSKVEVPRTLFYLLVLLKVSAQINKLTFFFIILLSLGISLLSESIEFLPHPMPFTRNMLLTFVTKSIALASVKRDKEMQRGKN